MPALNRLYEERQSQSKKEIPSIQEHSETELWIAFLKGSNAALSKIYRAYSNKLFTYGRQFTSNEALIKDAIQDVFFKLVDHKDQLGVAQSVKFYLYSSFRRILLRSLKRERKYVEEEEDGEAFYFLVDEDHFAMDALLNHKQKQMVKEACNELTARQREILNLRFFENLSYIEIAEMLDLANAKTVRTMLYRVLNKLSDKLSPFKRSLLSLIFSFIFLS
ncbi:RNA polymerase sigma factor [Echinicola shivajiensis]|uniref:RNA polymerase sigma factor n=1 Tax=Echinicola shivajiensis TaxID=1035916 RepID=UPI001BFC5F57|nr:sigma-70 family RNA polymerase sigma factor [Echinicola shivajiensis]